MTESILNEGMDKETIKSEILKKLKRGFGKTLADATKDEIYKSVALTVRDLVVDRWADANRQEFEQRKKRLYYLSAEFLMGRALVNNMINLHLLDDYKDALEELGLSLDDIEIQESDAGLGNGGLGRLAACFLDSLSTLDLPVTGCSIRYEHGLFRQKIENGEQKEEDDSWLENGNIWEIPRPEDKVEVHYGGYIEEVWTDEGLKVNHADYTSIIAVPYDYPVIGYESRMPATLRLWSARAKTELDINYFNRGDYAKAVEESALIEAVSQILYPEDNHEQGRILRMKQFYFFSSASMQMLVNRHKQHYQDIYTLPDHYTVQINDTHPTYAIPEMLRILMDEENLKWDEAFDIVSRMFNYTNHTIMSEALERWNENMFRTLLPRIYTIVQTIDKRFRDLIWAKWPGDVNKLNELAIIGNGEIRMANLCIAVCGKVNGVSQLHGEIIKQSTFRDFYILYPDKFLGITNGITHRRWLAKANQPLTKLITAHIGDGFLRDYEEMNKVRSLLSNEEFLKDFAAVKRENKIRLRDHLYEKQGIEIDPDSIFDVQAKRLHEYKRQLLKIMHILHLYYALKRNPAADITPSTFLFAAKASPGYYRAREIIRLILAVSGLINNDPETREKLKVVFIENYGVSEAEILIPATDVSEQLSTAGLEASGTGNMKFMLNGAVTIGTLDGANVEIYNEVGKDNIFIFGATVDEIERIKKYGNYNSKQIYNQNPEIKLILDTFISRSLPVSGDRQFNDLFSALVDGGPGKNDAYFLLHDFESYDEAFSRMMKAYGDQDRWTRMAATNTAHSGIFFADRTIREYNDKVWGLEALNSESFPSGAEGE
ncbi:MAG: glycogen/starch/alpha-glucan phosphorylase [Clostridiales Family XIII bacterium]|jgi:starch phosphorylase|nr:glycogen/starch/alpha-glucan phosphorylase [Clostridiales Family XIII bacterium]